MSIKGSYGFRYQGNDYLSFSNLSSQPKGLGYNLIQDFFSMEQEYIEKKLLELNYIDLNSHPTPEHKSIFSNGNKHLENIFNVPNSTYLTILSLVMPSIKKLLDIGIWFSNNNFIFNSKFCEYAYIFNLDDKNFEYYIGMQEYYHELGRYASNESIDNFYPCALKLSIPFEELNANDFIRIADYVRVIDEDNIEQVINKMEKQIENYHKT